jgi:hypothetical protein
VRLTWIGGGLIAATGIFGCSAPPRVDLPPPPALVSCPAPEAPRSPLQLGHYTTADGTIGLVLDRSNSVPRVQFDGSHEIVELTPLEVRGHGGTAGPLKGVAYLTPAGKRLLFVTKEGVLSLWPDGDDRPLVRDADATALPAPNVRGRWAREVSESERFVATLAPFTARAREPKLTSNDAGKLDVVERVLSETPPEALFVVERPEAFNHEPCVTPSVQFLSVAEGLPWTPSDAGLARFGVTIAAKTGIHGAGWLEPQRLEGFPNAPKRGAVGVVWEVDGRDVLVFVAANGERFKVAMRRAPWQDTYEPPLRREAPHPDGWPAELGALPLARESLLDAMVESDLSIRLRKADTAWTECAQRVLEGAGADQVAFAKADELPRQLRERTRAELDARWKSRIGEKCFAVIATYEAAYREVLERRSQHLVTLYQRVRQAHAKKRAASPSAAPSP